MKKYALLLICLLAVCLSWSVQAQFPVAKGTKLLELTGELGGNSTKTTTRTTATTSTSDIVLKFKAGYFVRENLVVGVRHQKC